MALKEDSAKYLLDESEWVPAGYKRTEVGLIPEDWKTPPLCEILKTTQLGGNYKNSERETNWPLIKMGNLGRGSINLDKIEFIDSSQTPSERDKLRKYDVLFNTRNTLELVGKVAIWRNELPEAFFNSNIMRMDFDKEHVSSNPFMNYILNTSLAIKSLRGIATGTTSVAAIYSRDLIKIRIPLPTKAEQEAIAEALSDADALIEALEQLIAKKRQLKQGAMQELLTGKRRLPGFSGEWEVKRLGELADIDSENLGSDTDPNLSFNYISLEDVDEGALRSYSEHVFRTAPSRARRKLRTGDILVSTVRPNLMSHLLFRAEEGRWICSTGFSVVRCKKDFSHPNYVYFHMFAYTVVKQIETLLTGSNYPAINGGDVRTLTIPLPTFEEQTAIAKTLSDMDSEVAELETKLAKARAVKQGMMQQLLTGKIRLV
jgi:type I restriction enzyme S subunit